MLGIGFRVAQVHESALHHIYCGFLFFTNNNVQNSAKSWRNVLETLETILLRHEPSVGKVLYDSLGLAVDRRYEPILMMSMTSSFCDKPSIWYQIPLYLLNLDFSAI